MNKLNFPTLNNKNVMLYYFLTIFLNGWFILPNWVFYFGKFITIVQIGLIDGISKIVGLVIEVPSGTISDIFGKLVFWRNYIYFDLRRPRASSALYPWPDKPWS